MPRLNLKSKSPFFWQAINTVLLLAMNIAYIVLMAHLIEKEVHGVFTILNVMIMFTAFLSESGVGSALVQGKECNENHIGSAIYTSLVLSAGFFVLLWSCSGWIAEFYDYKFTAILVQVIAINIMVATFRIIPRSLLIRDLAFGRLFFVDCGSFLLGKLLLGSILAMLGYGIWAFVVGILANSILAAAFASILRPYSLKIAVRAKELAEVTYFGISLTLVRLLSYATTQLDKLILGKLIDTDALAIFEKSQFVTTLPPKIVGDSCDPVLFSILSRNQHDIEFLRNSYSGFLGLALVICIYSVSVIASLNEEVPSLLLGAKWSDCGPIVGILIYLVPMMIIVRFGDIIVRSANKLYYSIPIKLLFIGLLSLAVFAGFKKGLETIAIYFLASYAVYCVLMLTLTLVLLKCSLAKIFQPLAEAKWCLLYCLIKATVINPILVYNFESPGLTIVLAVIMDLIMLIFSWKCFKFFFYGRTNIETIEHIAKPNV